MLTRVGVPVESEAEPSAPDHEPTTLICFSHLRWNFVFQRPQHLMSRFARDMAVIYWEEPIEIGAKETAFLKVREAEDAKNVRVAVPHLPHRMP
jgi:UDP-galactopyranose mutase